MSVRSDPPETGRALRDALYAGEIFRRAPSPASEGLVEDVWALVSAELGPEPRLAHARFSELALFEAVGRIRKMLFTEPRIHERVRAVVAAAGFDPARSAFDPLRLRVVAHAGHENPRARAVYYPHRDTWYGHSSSIVTFWVALHDAPASQTFAFYPDAFARPVPNSSELFDYDDWVARGWDLRIGWQNRDDGLTAEYPGVVGSVEPGREVGFACRRGDLLLFSGAHFHATRPQSEDTTRFSLDFRVVDLDDHAEGRGAPNVDDRSKGDALPDYVQPVAAAASEATR